MDLIEFMKSHMHHQCLQDHKIYQLLDFEESTEGFWTIEKGTMVINIIFSKN